MSSAILLVACGGGGASSGGSTESSGGSGGETTASPNVVASYSGTLAGSIDMVLELDDAGGGTIRYPSSGETMTLSGCSGSGATLTCRTSDGSGRGGDIELTRREDGSGIDGRARADSDGTWVEISADANR